MVENKKCSKAPTSPLMLPHLWPHRARRRRRSWPQGGRTSAALSHHLERLEGHGLGVGMLEKCWRNFGEMLEKFWRNVGENLEKVWRNGGENVGKNCVTIKKHRDKKHGKPWTNMEMMGKMMGERQLHRKNMETLWTKCVSSCQTKVEQLKAVHKKLSSFAAYGYSH